MMAVISFLCSGWHGIPDISLIENSLMELLPLDLKEQDIYE
jgi:hypothetical protein